MADEVKPLWQQNHGRAQRQYVRTLLQVARAEPRRISKMVYVLGFVVADVDQDAIDAFQAGPAATYAISRLTALEGEYPFYVNDSDWRPEAGTIFVELTASKMRSKLRYGGIWRVREDGSVPIKPGADGKPRNLILCDELLDIDGWRLPKQEQSELSRLAGAYLTKHGLWDATKVEDDGSLIEMPLVEFLTKAAV